MIYALISGQKILNIIEAEPEFIPHIEAQYEEIVDITDPQSRDQYRIGYVRNQQNDTFEPDPNSPAAPADVNVRLAQLELRVSLLGG